MPQDRRLTHRDMCTCMCMGCLAPCQLSQLLRSGDADVNLRDMGLMCKLREGGCSQAWP